MQLVTISSSERFGSSQMSSPDDRRSYCSRSSIHVGHRAEPINACEVQRCNSWEDYHKPITITVIGVLVFLVGITLTILYFTRVTEVPYALGPVCLSIGLMFIVTGLVWIPIVKQKLRHSLK
uniref:Phosphoinositide-interacting protein n=1 Tax=Callorhinchus milii TaxID=7868 RepID=A0A4W3HWW6_CALMI